MKLVKKFSKFEILLIVVLFVLFLFSRIYKISEIPSSVYWDEASIGYNALSISIDGRDEWGDLLPIHFRAFGEFKLPVFIYSVVPFVKLFGLNEYSLRIPAVIYSILTLIVIYLITYKITKKRISSIIASFIFSVCPWYFIFSRTGYEATAGIFYLLLGIYFYFIREKNIIYIPLTFLCFILAIYSYNSFRIIVPLVVLYIIPDFIINELKNKRKINSLVKRIGVLGFSLLILVISFYPIYRLYKFDYGGVRFGRVSIIESNQGFTKNIGAFVKNYVTTFSYKFLITEGDTIYRSQMPGHGEVYIIAIPFILTGLYFCIKNYNRYSILILFLLIISPIPSAITKESPHALRSLLMSPMFAIISGIGIDKMFVLLKKYANRLYLLILTLYLIFFGNYFLDYINNYNYLTQKDWQYGYKQIFTNKVYNLNSKKKVVISSEYGQPYIFALYYQKYNPKLFRKSVTRTPPDDWGFLSVSAFDKYIFKKTDKNDIIGGNIVFSDVLIDGFEEFITDSIYNSDGTRVLVVYEK